MDAQGNSVVAGQFQNTYGWFARFDTSGRLLWQKRLGSVLDEAWGVAIDQGGNIIVAGETDYSSTTGTNAWVEKYTSSGRRIWGRRFNSGGREGDDAFRVAVDAANNIYIAGTSGQPTTTDSDALLVKFSPTGTLQWQKPLGTIDQDTLCNGLAVDRSNNILLVGTTYGPLFGPDPSANNRDAWVAKIDPNGRTLWGKQIPEPRSGSRIAYGNAVATDAQNNVLIFGEANSGGRLTGSTQAGKLFLLKFAPNGTQTWVRQFEYPANRSYQEALAIAVDASNNVLVAGDIGINSSGGAAYVRKYSPSGGLVWDSSLSSGGGEAAFGVATDRLGHVFVAGSTYGNLGATNQGRDDGFLAKFPPR